MSVDSLGERTAILRRYRKLLVAQRERFLRYLNLLDQQRDVIETGSAGSLLKHIEGEESILKDIAALDKVIGPMRAMYHTAYPERREKDIREISTSLETLKEQAAKRLRQNKDLLAERLERLRDEIKTLRASRPFVQRRSLYAQSHEPSLLDIKG